MLKSLFGELTPAPIDAARPREGFQATRIYPFPKGPGVSTDRGVDPFQQDLFVSGSPAQAMRSHLAKLPPDEGHHVVTLLDTHHHLAPRLIQNLSEATGHPVQRLNIRHHASQHVMATLERVVVPRRGDASLKLYHADVPPWQGERAPEDDSPSMPMVLMESSSLAAVVVAPMPAADLDDMLAKLAAATQSTHWRCPTLLFVLSPETAWAEARIRDTEWPGDVQVDVVDEPSPSPARTWNALLMAWDRHDLSLVPDQTLTRMQVLEQGRIMGRELRNLMGTPGILGCAVAECQSGTLVVGESHDASLDLRQVSAALASTLRGHQDGWQRLDGAAPLDEIVLCAGTDQFVVRPGKRLPEFFLFAKIDPARSNLTLARLKIADAHRALD